MQLRLPYPSVLLCSGDKSYTEFKFVHDAERNSPREKEVKVELNLFRDYYNSQIVHYFVHIMYK